MRRKRATMLMSGLVLAGCATARVPTIDDHYAGGTPFAPGLPSAPPIAYQPSDISFDPILPVRTPPETIAVLELGHAGDDGTWIAPHYVVVLVRPEAWADQYEPAGGEPTLFGPPATAVRRPEPKVGR